jgi:drug/metabolite transporter (DMT)-like permease
MLAVVLALGASLGWGTSDFLGGLKSRRVPLLSVLLISQATALVTLAVIVLARGASPPDRSSLYYAAIAGVSETVGIAALYRGLAVGTMSIVAPVAATAPAVPLLAGLALGEVPGPIQRAGLVLAVAGVVIISYRQDPGAGTTSRLGPSTLYGVLAAVGFGAFFVAMDTASEGSIPWALLTARATAVTIIVAVRRHRLAVHRTDLPVIALIGVLIVTADSLYATASTLGMVGIVAVLGSLHTIVTIALARIFLHERLERLQQIGIATSICGVLAIAAT